ncbi:MAG: GNAT family N-acetyltransferase [Gammaproteobacteria bacterium]|jgi:GNAT superfamily N-acetyltransferase|nr:GNAT family N-acetyltransferase [Gammaproteobacteria bacterium]
MISIRNATVVDAPKVHALHVASSTAVYQQFFGGKGLEQWLATRSPEVCAAEIAKWAVIIAEEDDLIVGFAALDTAKTNIDAVYVAPDRWRQGIGRQLLIHLEEIARTAGLSRVTLQAAGPAIRFYQRQGYVSPKELGPNPSWAEMEKHLG